MYQNYWLGRTYYCYGYLDSAIPHFRDATNASVPDIHSNNDIDRRDRLLKGRSWGHLGSIYGRSSHPFKKKTESPMLNLWESIRCYGEEATIFNYPGSMYIYGMALVYGTGGVTRNIAEGIEYLNKAGAERIGEAYLELGSIYEHGIGLCPTGIERDVAVAKDYYEEAFRVYNLKENWRNDGWIPEIWGVQGLLFSEAWHISMRAFGDVLGERFNWNVAGQAFLFSAGTSYLIHESSTNSGSTLWGFWIPCIGIYVQVFYAILLLGDIYSMSYELRKVEDMHDAKMAAYKAIVDAVKQLLPDTPHPFKNAVLREKGRVVNSNFWRFKKYYFIWFLSSFAFIVYLHFIGAWISYIADVRPL